MPTETLVLKQAYTGSPIFDVSSYTALKVIIANSTNTCTISAGHDKSRMITIDGNAAGKIIDIEHALNWLQYSGDAAITILGAIKGGF